MTEGGRLSQWRTCAAMPGYLQAVWVVHLLTGVVFVSGTFFCSDQKGKVAASVLLCSSIMAVLVLCRCTAAAAGNRRSAGGDKAGGGPDLEAPIVVSCEEFATGLGSKCVCEGPCDVSSGNVASPPPAAVGDQDPAAAAAEEAPMELRRSNTKEAIPDMTSEEEEEEEEEEEKEVVIPVDASLLEGLKVILEHHLRRTGVETLTQPEADLLAHHLGRLASYGQKIVHTLAYSQQVVTQPIEGRAEAAQQPPAPRPGDDDSSAQAGAEAAAEEAAQKDAPTKTLRLSDREIMAIFKGAQREAEREADWRNIEPPNARNSLGDVVVGAGADGGPLSDSAAPTPARADETCASSPGARPAAASSGKVQERADAIDLLSQALSLQEGADETDALAFRLLPARPTRRCDVGDACCATILGDEDPLPAAMPKSVPVLPPANGGGAGVGFASLAAGQTSVLQSSEGPYAGMWQTDEGEIIQISGRTVAWPSGAFSVVTPQSDSSMAMILEGRILYARLRAGSSELLWDDGAVWKRVAAAGARARFAPAARTGAWHQEQSFAAPSAAAAAGRAAARPTAFKGGERPSGPA